MDIQASLNDVRELKPAQILPEDAKLGSNHREMFMVVSEQVSEVQKVNHCPLALSSTLQNKDFTRASTQCINNQPGWRNGSAQDF